MIFQKYKVLCLLQLLKLFLVSQISFRIEFHSCRVIHRIITILPDIMALICQQRIFLLQLLQYCLILNIQRNQLCIHILKFPDDFMHSLFMSEQSVNTQTEHRKCQYYDDPGHLKCGIGMFPINPECHRQRKQTGQQRDH